MAADISGSGATQASAAAAFRIFGHTLGGSQLGGLPLLAAHQFQQELGRQVGAVCPRHRTHFRVLIGGCEQGRIAQGLEHLAAQVVSEAYLSGYAIVEAQGYIDM